MQSRIKSRISVRGRRGCPNAMQAAGIAVGVIGDLDRLNVKVSIAAAHGVISSALTPGGVEPV